MNPPTKKPTEAQSRFLEIVYKGARTGGRPVFPSGRAEPRPHRVGREPDAWPIFQYVEAVLYRKHGIDARALISELRASGSVPGRGRYGWIQVERPGAA